jgi:hypothetical protein
VRLTVRQYAQVKELVKQKYITVSTLGRVLIKLYLREVALNPDTFAQTKGMEDKGYDYGEEIKIKSKNNLTTKLKPLQKYL